MQRRQSQLTIGFDPQWRRQSAWDVPNDAANLTAAFPATSRNWLDLDETIEDIDDCTGEDLLLELLTGRVARLTIDMDFDPDLFAGFAAAAYGVAASPSGGTNEVQTLTITASGGTYNLTVMVGADAQTTTDIAFDANAAAVQAALEALSNVGAGDLVVAGTGPMTITGAVNFAKQDINLIIVNTQLLTGGTATIVETTPGVGQTHNISRTTGYSLPLLTFYLGFRGSDKQPVIFKNVVVDQIRVRSSSRAKVTATVQLIGSADLQDAVGYTMPGCYNIVPLRFGDCKMSIGGTDYIAANLGREYEYYYQNDVVPQFDGAGVDVTRLERASKRPSGMNMFILGEKGDAIYNLGKAKATLNCFIQCGTTGRNIKFIAPQGLVKLAPTAIRFGGDPAESEVAIVVRPKKVSGQNTTPTNVVAVSKQATAFMTSA